jgi:hypothetical protein
MHLISLLYLDTLIVCTVLALIVTVYLGSEIKKILMRDRTEGES